MMLYFSDFRASGGPVRQASQDSISLGSFLDMSTANLRLIRLVIPWQTVGRTTHLDGLFLGLFLGLFHI